MLSKSDLFVPLIKQNSILTRLYFRVFSQWKHAQINNRGANGRRETKRGNFSVEVQPPYVPFQV